MLKAVDIVFSRTCEGHVGNLKAFCSPILYSDLVKPFVLGCDDELGSRHSAIVPGEAHDAFWSG